MAALSWYAFYVGYLLLILTLGSSAYAVWRLRQRHRLDILFFISVLALVHFVRRPGGHFALAGWVLLLTLPYALCRLVQHFRDLPKAIFALVKVMAVAGPLAYVLRSQGASWPLTDGLHFYITAVFAYATVAFALEARHAAGVVRRRLVLASLGSSFLGATFTVG